MDLSDFSSTTCLQHEPSKDARRQNIRVHLQLILYSRKKKKKCTNSEINWWDVLTTHKSGLIVRCGFGAVVNQLLLDGWHLEPWSISLLPHMSAHLQLCHSVGNKQAANS